MNNQLELLKQFERKILWLSSWMIHNANHIRPKADKIKIGGHQASCASITTIMTSLYLNVLNPEDRVAVKPHASPVFHAIQYLFGNQTQEKIANLRGFGGAQSYPSRTKDIDDVDFSTGSVGLGVAQTLFSSLIQDYIKAKKFGQNVVRGRMVALVGDAELDEGNVYEALIEGYKHDLKNCWWIIDYNRQSLDATIREGLNDKFIGAFENYGWDVIILKYGSLQQAAFKEPGGAVLKDFIDDCENATYSALTFQGASAWHAHFAENYSEHPEFMALVAKRSDAELDALMTNLGGHDLELLTKTFNNIDHDRPVCFIAYTIKGYGLPFAGHKDNHSGLMNVTQMNRFRDLNNIREGHEWELFEGLDSDAESLQGFIDRASFNKNGKRRTTAPYINVPNELTIPSGRHQSTQEAFGKIMDNIGKMDDEFAGRVVTTSPDVSVSTGLAGWINRKGLFDHRVIADIFADNKIVSTQKWGMNKSGQHIELGIAESNLMLNLSAMGLTHSLHGERLFPIGTVYDPFVARALDQLNYACYQGARFLLVGTPSGISLAPEGGAHQSIGTPLIGISQDGLAYFEPAFADELATIMAWSFDYMQRDGSQPTEKEQSWLRDETGGSVYLRLTTRPLEQINRVLDNNFKQSILDGAYWLRPPSTATEVVIAYTGAVAPEAIEAAGLIGEDRRNVAVLAITSADRASAGWHAAERARQRGNEGAISHIEKLLSQVPRDAGMVTVVDGHPLTLSWIGAVLGHKVKSLGVEHFGQTGTVAELYHYYGLDANAIAHAANSVVKGRPVRYLTALSKTST
ncbi:MAG: transketolase [Rhizobiales bacterium]|nr:transketolase [Hyphomicrobiales bacterium]NRB14349.1 transketolase [Hyphomicrobiales bacterium]